MQQRNNNRAVYVFVRDTATDTWYQQAYIKASNVDTNDHLGYSISLSGNLIAAGAINEEGDVDSDGTIPGSNDNANDAGAVYLFTREPVTGIWSQSAYLKASNAETNDRFGESVVLSGDDLVAVLSGRRGRRLRWHPHREQQQHRRGGCRLHL